MNAAAAPSVPDAAVDQLVRAAADGVDWLDLTAGRHDDGYRLRVGETDRSGLSEAAFREAAHKHGAHVAEWHFWTTVAPETAASRAFLRWLESWTSTDLRSHRSALMDGQTTTWGQLSIAVDLDADGRRRYGIRHVADIDQPSEALSAPEDSAAFRDLVRYDDRGQYRPLKSAPTLATGWVREGLDAEALLEAVETCYPASIANWHREREGELDVTHWAETAERQTGIYDVVDELAGEQVEWLAEACCVDSQCLKRREWDETAADPLGVPRGDGDFPCREPCSFVIAAAREFAMDAREDDERTTIEMGERDLAQLERILAAVADGEIEDIRDGDHEDGANRLRARYLRAKLGAEDGHEIGGEPQE